MAEEATPGACGWNEKLIKFIYWNKTSMDETHWEREKPQVTAKRYAKQFHTIFVCKCTKLAYKSGQYCSI